MRFRPIESLLGVSLLLFNGLPQNPGESTPCTGTPDSVGE